MAGREMTITPGAGRKLSKQQRRVLQCILDYHARYGIPPTYREICDEIGLGSTSGAHYYVRQLEIAGYVEVLPTISRGIRILRQATVEPPENIVTYIENVLRGSSQLPPGVRVERRENEIVLSWPNNGPRHTVRFESAA